MLKDKLPKKKPDEKAKEVKKEVKTEVKPVKKITYICTKTCTFPKETPVISFTQGQKVTKPSDIAIAKNSKYFKLVK